MTLRNFAQGTGAGVFSAHLFFKKLVHRGDREPRWNHDDKPQPDGSEDTAPGGQKQQDIDEALRALSILETGYAPVDKGGDPGFAAPDHPGLAWALERSQRGIPFEAATEWLKRARGRAGTGDAWDTRKVRESLSAPGRAVVSLPKTAAPIAFSTLEADPRDSSTESEK